MARSRSSRRSAPVDASDSGHDSAWDRIKRLARDPLLFAVGLVAVLAAAAALATLVIASGWGNGDLKTWDAWLGIVQKLATIVALAGGAYIAYRRFIGGGGVLGNACK